MSKIPYILHFLVGKFLRIGLFYFFYCLPHQFIKLRQFHHFRQCGIRIVQPYKTVKFFRSGKVPYRSCGINKASIRFFRVILLKYGKASFIIGSNNIFKIFTVLLRRQPVGYCLTDIILADKSIVFSYNDLPWLGYVTLFL